MNLANYSKYKHTNIDWLGDIPEHWSFGRIKSIGSVNGRVGWKALKAAEYVDSGYFFLSTPNIKERNIDYLNVNYITHERFVESPEIILKEDDILLTKDGSTLGTVNIVKNLPGPGTVNSSIAVLRFNNKVNNDYAYFLIVSNYIQNAINLKKDGMGVPHLFQKDINNLLLLVPTLPEQNAIAVYLSKRSFSIDTRIALLEQKIKHYQQLRKSLINETICRGLNKIIKLKDSGEIWIRQVPYHWEVKRGKNIFIERSTKGHSGEPLLAASQKKGVVLKSMLSQRSMEAQKDFHNFKLVKIDDFVISLRSFEGGIETAYYRGIISPVYTVFHSSGYLSISYFKHLFKSDVFINYLKSKITGIRDGQSIKFVEIQNTFFPIPPISEQKDIATYLDKKTQIIDTIIINITKQISTLKELRKTLINDVVTGKLKVTE